MSNLGPKRSQYLGSFAVPPAPTEAGQWWYRSDLGIFCYWDGTIVQCWGGSGGKIAEDSVTTVYATGGDKSIAVIVAGITAINYILHIRFLGDPAVDSGNPINESITGNIVGFTLVSLGAGTTLTTTVTVRGW